MPSSQRDQCQPRVLFSSCIFLTLLLWGGQHNARADTPTIPSSCALQKISKDVSYSYALNTDGSRFAFASLTSKQKRPRHPWTEPSYTEQFFLLNTHRRKRTKIARHTYEGRERIPYVDMNAGGNKVVFASAGNLTGENADGNSEIFLFDATSKMRSQITKTTESDNLGPVISANGQRLAFLTNTNSTGELTDSHTVLTLLDLATGSATEIARTTAFSSLIWGFSLNGDGTKIALASNIDLTGTNADGTVEIFLWNAATGTFTQLTSTIGSETNSGNSSSPTISADGTRIAFRSVADLTGANADGDFEIFLFDVPTATISQLTHAIGSSGLYSDPSISADGTRIVFEGNKDLLTGNSDNIYDGNDTEIFLFDTTTATLTQLTSSNGTNASPMISADGTHIAFISRISRRTFLVGADLNGYNTDNQKPDPTAGIYLATCP